MSIADSVAGKSILVTGASSGIGRATAQHLAARGANLVLSGRDEKRLHDCKASLGAGTHVTHAGDLTDIATIAALVDYCPSLDGVVHSAGIAQPTPAKLIGEAHFDRLMSINVRTPILLTQRILFKGRLRPGGSLVFMSSIAAHTGTRGTSVYSASKAALEGFIRPLALELLPRRARVNCIAPAVVRTEIFTREQATWLDEQDKRYPLGIGTPEDVANAIIFLMSDLAQSITGTTLVMDGGCISIM